MITSYFPLGTVHTTAGAFDGAAEGGRDVKFVAVGKREAAGDRRQSIIYPFQCRFARPLGSELRILFFAVAIKKKKEKKLDAFDIFTGADFNTALLLQYID